MPVGASPAGPEVCLGVLRLAVVCSDRAAWMRPGFALVRSLRWGRHVLGDLPDQEHGSLEIRIGRLVHHGLVAMLVATRSIRSAA